MTERTDKSRDEAQAQDKEQQEQPKKHDRALEQDHEEASDPGRDQGPDQESARLDDTEIGEDRIPELDDPLFDDPLLDDVAFEPEQHERSQAEPGAADSADDPPQPKQPKGRLLASLAVLLGLGAIAGVAYLYYQLVYLDPMQSLRAANEQLNEQQQTEANALEAGLEQLRTEQGAALDAFEKAQAEQLASTERAVLESLQDALSAAPPSQREWKLAEAEYLLRIANHRVLMQQDTRGALLLLEAADKIIEDLDDFALHQVRARLADEIIALKQVPRDDLQGIYLSIEAVKSQLDELDFATPDYVQDRATPDEDRSVWAQLAEALKQFVRVRTLAADETVTPLLAPDEEHYLELNMRLALEQAQLATLKRHQAVYEHSLQNVRTWLARYMDSEQPATAALLDELDTLLQAELAHPLPDISGSLNELLAMGRAGS